MAWIKRFGRSNSSKSESGSFSSCINEFAKEFKDKFDTSIFGQRAETLHASMNQFVRVLKDKCLSKGGKVTVTSCPIACGTDSAKCDENVIMCAEPTLNVTSPSPVTYSNSLICNNQFNNLDRHASEDGTGYSGNYIGGLGENRGVLRHSESKYRSYDVPTQKAVTSLKQRKHVNRGSGAHLLWKFSVPYQGRRLKNPPLYSKNGNKYGKHRWPPPPEISVYTDKTMMKIRGSYSVPTGRRNKSKAIFSVELTGNKHVNMTA